MDPNLCIKGKMYEERVIDPDIKDEEDTCKAIFLDKKDDNFYFLIHADYWKRYNPDALKQILELSADDFHEGRDYYVHEMMHEEIVVYVMVEGKLQTEQGFEIEIIKEIEE